MYRSLFYWIFVPLVQQELNAFCKYWNNHRIRKQDQKLMPSGHVPSHTMEYPEQYGGIDCRIEIPKEAVTELRNFLEEDTGKSREECLQWYSDDFAVLAELHQQNLGVLHRAVQLCAALIALIAAIARVPSVQSYGLL